MHKIVYLAVKKGNILVNINSRPFLITINFDKETEKNKDEDLIIRLEPRLSRYPGKSKGSCNSASGRQRHLGVIVMTILQTGMK